MGYMTDAIGAQLQIVVNPGTAWQQDQNHPGALTEA